MFSNLDSRLTSTPKRQTGNKKVNSDNQLFEFNSGDETDNTMINNRLDDLVRNLNQDKERHDSDIMKLNLKLDDLSSRNDQLVNDNLILKEKLDVCLKFQSKFSLFESKYIEINRDLSLLKSSKVNPPSLNNDVIIDLLQKGLNQLSVKLHKDIERVNDKLDSVSLAKPMRYNGDSSSNHISFIGNSVSNSGGFNYSEDDDSVDNKSAVSLSNQNDRYIEGKSVQKSSNPDVPKISAVKGDSKLQNKSQELINPLISSTNPSNLVHFTPPKTSFNNNLVNNQKSIDNKNEKNVSGFSSSSYNSGALISNKTSSAKPLFGNVTNTNSIFGNTTNSDTSKNLFQNPVDHEKSIFGQNKNSVNTPSLFNNSPTNMFKKPSEDPISIFGQNKNSDKPSSLINNSKANMFIKPTEEPNSIFGQNKNPDKHSPTNMFIKPAEETNSIFGQNKNPDKLSNLINNSPTNMFIKPTEEPNSIFGQNKNSDKPTSLFSKDTKTNNTTNSLFGNSTGSKTTIFNSDTKSSNPDSKSLFGNSIFQSQEASTKQSIFSNPDGPSFSSLASNCADFKFGTSETHTWKAGGKLFENSTTKTTEDSEPVEEDSKDHEEECSAHFEPIVELPTIKSQTDVDLFDELFRNRCKLFRRVDNEWKERGVGDIKVVKAKDSDDQKYRIIMRREKIAKLGCNHFILKDCPKFTPMSNEKSVCWVAQDFSEGELKVETFAVKFSNESIMVEFKRVVQEIQDKLQSN